MSHIEEKKKLLQPTRMDYAKQSITDLGYEITFEDDTRIEFYYKDHVVKMFPYSGWHTGQTIQDGRGITKLLNQIKKK